MRGPIDYVIVGFKGNNFDGSMLDEITKAAKQNIIKVLDLLFIIKDKDGNVTEAEFADQSDDLKDTFGELTVNEDTPLLTESDVVKISEDMANDTAAGVLVIEHTWAKGLKQAIIDAGGFLMADGRIHDDTVEAAMRELATSEA